MATQSLDFDYRVSGDRAVVSSLRRVSTQLSRLERDMAALNRKSVVATTNASKAATVAGGTARAVGSSLRGLAALSAASVRTAASGVASVTRLVSGTTTALARTSADAVRLVTRAGTGILRVTGNVSRKAIEIALAARKITLLGGALVGFLGFKLGNAAANADQKMTAFSLSLEQATGSVEAAGQEIEYVQKLASQLGTEFDGLRQPYAGLANAIVGAGGSMEIARENFLGIVQAGQAMGTSAEDIQGALLAISQVASKGRVSLEEISGQLGERIPGALALAARSMNMTTSEFTKLVETGQLEALPFLEKFGKALQVKFAAGAEKAADDFQSSVARFRNAFKELLRVIGRSGVADAMKRLFNELARIITAFTGGEGENFGQGLARGIDRFTASLAKNVKAVYAYFVLVTRGREAYVRALRAFNDDSDSRPSNVSSMTGARTFQDLLSMESAVPGIIRAKRIASSLFEVIGNGARASFKAVRQFILGFFRGSLGNQFKSGADFVVDIIGKIVDRIKAMTADGAFYRFGYALRDVVETIVAAIRLLFTDTGEAARRAMTFLVSLIPGPIKKVGRAMFDAFVSVFNVLSRLGPLFKPIAVRLGLMAPAAVQLRNASDKIAYPFEVLASTLNGLVENGSIDRFAERTGAGIEKIFGFIFRLRGAFTLLNSDNPLNEKILADNYEFGPFLIAVKKIGQMFITVGETIGAFWNKFGEDIKKAHDVLTSFLEPFAKFLGVETGGQVLILLFLFKLIGGFRILFGILSLIGKGVGFTLLLSSMLRVRSLLTGISTGAISVRAGLTQIGKIGAMEALARKFPVLTLLFRTLEGAVKALKFVAVSSFNIIKGSVVALAQSVKTLSFAPIANAFKSFGGAVKTIATNIVRNLSYVVQAVRLIGTAFSKAFGLLSRIVTPTIRFIFRGALRFILGWVPGLFSAILPMIGAGLSAIGSAIAAFFAAAPVAATAVVLAVIAAVVALAYTFREEIEAAFSAFGDWLYGAIEYLFGTKIANFISNAFSYIGDPIKAAWTYIMDGIDSILSGGFRRTIDKILGFFSGIGNKIKSFFGFKVNIRAENDNEATGGSAANAPRYAGGGRVRGPGTGTSDSILAWLSNNEYVIRAKRAMQFRPILDLINYGSGSFRDTMAKLSKMGLPAFADGGPVNMPRFAFSGAPGGASPSNLVQFYLPNGQRVAGDYYTNDDPANLDKAFRKAYTGRVRGGPRGFS